MGLVEEQHVVADVLQLELEPVTGLAALVDLAAVLRECLGAGLVGLTWPFEVRAAVFKEPHIGAHGLHRRLVVEHPVDVVGHDQDVRPACAIPLVDQLHLGSGADVEVLDTQMLLDADEEVLHLFDKLANQLGRHGEDHLVAQGCHQDGVGLSRVGLACAGVRSVKESHLLWVLAQRLQLVIHRPERQGDMVEPGGVASDADALHQGAEVQCRAPFRRRRFVR